MSTLQFPKNPSINDEYDWEGFKYVYDGQKWKTIGVGYNPVNDLRDELITRVNNVGTVADIAAGKFKVGTVVTVTDRSNAPFKVVSGGTADGYGVLNAGNGNTAVVESLKGEIDVKWLGTLGGSDESNIINAAIDRAVLLKVDLIFSGGTYRMQGVWLKSGLKLIGRGAPVLMPVSGGTGNIFKAQSKSNVLLRNLNFKGDSANVTYSNVVEFSQCTDVNLEGCNFEDCKGITAIFNACFGVKIEGGSVLNCGIQNRTSGNHADRRQAFAFSGIGGGHKVLFVKFTNVGLDCVSYATAQSDVEIFGCEVDSNDAGSFYLSGCNRFKVIGNTISNKSGGGNAIDVPNSKNGIISDNICRDSGAAGILIAENCENIIVSGNKCYNNNSSGVSVHQGGITLYALNGTTMRNILIDSNMCYDSRAGTTAVTQKAAIDINLQSEVVIEKLRVTKSNQFTGYSSSGVESATSTLRQNPADIFFNAVEFQIYKNFADTNSVPLCGISGSVKVDILLSNTNEFATVLVNNGSLKVLNDINNIVSLTDTGTKLAVYNNGAGKILLKNRTGLVRAISYKVSEFLI